jgi:hypothetical protein
LRPLDQPDVCQGQLDSAALLRGELFAFSGSRMWRFSGGREGREWYLYICISDRNKLRAGYPAPFAQMFPFTR